LTDIGLHLEFLGYWIRIGWFLGYWVIDDSINFWSNIVGRPSLHNRYYALFSGFMNYAGPRKLTKTT